jgi:hypothetical protein
MSALYRRIALALALVAAPVVVTTTIDTSAHADKKNPNKDPLADKFAGQILFYDKSPPATVGGPGWFAANKISKREENSDKKWVLHMMVFLKKPLDVNKLDVMVYKTDKKGNTDFVQKLEQFPSGDGRSFYFVVTLKKYDPVAIEPNLMYTFKALATTGPVAEGKIELDGKEEKIGGSDLDFTKGDLAGPDKGSSDSSKPTDPFDATYAKAQLDKIIYEDCKTTKSNGDGKILISLDAKTGKAVKVEFSTDPAPNYEKGAMACVVKRFETVKVKPFANSDPIKIVAWKVSF